MRIHRKRGGNLFTISIDEKYKKQNYILFYYPYQVTEWQLEYKPFPFMKKKKEKRNLITNLTKKETNFYDNHLVNLETINHQKKPIILPINYEKENLENVAVKYLQNHYIHKKKVWSYPVITLLNTYSLYIPYFVGTEKRKGKNVNVLLEPATGNTDVLIKYEEIQNYLKERKVI